MANVSVSPSSVSFPASESSAPTSYYHQAGRSTHLPFRRISIPSAPNLLHRQSVVSVASFDSLPEEQQSAAGGLGAERNGQRRQKGRPPSLDAIGKRNSKRSMNMRPVDEAKEAKRLRVIREFYDTEKAYVEGLDLIYANFLTPIISSLDTPHPLLSRDELTSVFSNFIDIWNFHRSFVSSLSDLMAEATPPPMASTLLSHFPYLSLYSPFVTSFPAAMVALNSLQAANTQFRGFVAAQEANPQCGRLRLRDWLLTIVQRCPRYLLLLKDLISCTDPDGAEYTQLVSAHTLVSKITISLNTSLHTHSQTLALLALQRATPNLPIQLITPGRTFLKRGPLLQLERSSARKEREFLLFSDCLIWLANANAEKGDDELAEDWGWVAASKDKEKEKEKRMSMGFMGLGRRPPMIRTRSKSAAELSSALQFRAHGSESGSPSPSSPSGNTSAPTSPMKRKARQSSNGGEEKWAYKGKCDLVDLEVVVTPTRDGEWRCELLSPEASFVVYASTQDERDEWCTAIRNAKSSLLASLNAMNPNSTLTSSASTHHLRRSLQALPHSPEDNPRQPRRGKVEHFVPAIWIPDAKTESCMRCGKSFNWRRRRHHCRLCGRCVCAGCSSKTFFVLDEVSKSSTKSARSCDACYDTVFPLLDSADTPPEANLEEQFLPQWQSGLSTFRNLSALLSAPPMPIPAGPVPTPDALMAMPGVLGSPSKRALHRIDDKEDADEDANTSGTPTPRVRRRSTTRPRSYQQIPEDFLPPSADDGGGFSAASGSPPPAVHFRGILRRQTDGEAGISEEEEPESPDLEFAPRKEDTTRRRKRFSLPVLAVHTVPVTVQPSPSPAKSKRVSLRDMSDDGEGRAQGGMGSGGSGGVAMRLSGLLGRG
ncbi:hypothetical protein FIBSPDRAFT_837909 [Athelia psychrophila]|uniref:Dbl homology domain-containing protein n=1 Tax=Athelia psychrophila TaxID=1759441 RepID=A0A166A0Y0_9AGAM|nr:hypothetical protein FIBSPDRAFT_837909 [Fibularhizoctonia sp. CBS 109695]